MPLVAAILLLISYLVGAIPFGYIVGRCRGVNLFQAGSGNIGATNAARVLGARFGALVFALDLLKGVLPTAFIVPAARALVDVAPDVATLLRVGAAAVAFLGHLFPIYLGFRGGKGVATGAGAILVLIPGPAILAILSWVIVLLVSRTVSLASLAAVAVLLATRIATTRAPFAHEELPITLFVIAGTTLVFLKHRGNIGRLIRGTESQIREFSMRQTILRALHILSLGFWFGGAAFFNFVTAPTMFSTFREVVYASPSDRTADETIIPSDAAAGRKDALASALAGAAVGPVFPKYFAMQAICGLVAQLTAVAWWNAPGSVHRWRVYLIGFALLTAAVGWPLSYAVSEVRVLRYSADPVVAAAAKVDFGNWHLISLLLSFVTIGLAGVALGLAARLPVNVQFVGKSSYAE
jgi:acyl-phosphate glycerol 3-phosphate acyltransferase